MILYVFEEINELESLWVPCSMFKKNPSVLTITGFCWAASSRPDVQALTFRPWRSGPDVQALTFRPWRSGPDVHALTFRAWRSGPDVHALTFRPWRSPPDVQALTFRAWRSRPDVHALTFRAWRSGPDVHPLTFRPWRSRPDVHALTFTPWHLSYRKQESLSQTPQTENTGVQHADARLWTRRRPATLALMWTTRKR